MAGRYFRVAHDALRAIAPDVLILGARFIAYGTGADFAVLQAIAEASSSAVYDASDPRSINKVFAQVISNF